MKIHAAVVLVIAFAAAAFVGKLGLERSVVDGDRIQMSSFPFPAIAGPTTFYFAVVDANGRKYDNVTVDAVATMDMDGMLPMRFHATPFKEGWYAASYTFGMMGQYTVRVAATLPSQQVVRDTFKIYVYPVEQMAAAGARIYKSEREITAARDSNIDHERWIIIPQGTQALLRGGMGDNIIPSVLHLSLTGQNTLVIRNDDVADHKVGPFFIRAGETIRQEFRTPATFVGTCTIRHGAEVSIIVD